MSDPTVTNNKASNDANTNSDIPVRATAKSGKEVQHVILDWGGSESEDTSLGKDFIARLLHLVWQILEFVRAPSFMTKVALGDKINVLFTSDSTVPTVAAVTTVTTVSTVTNLTNINNIDAREQIWSMWDLEYNAGIRNKIV